MTICIPHGYTVVFSGSIIGEVVDYKYAPRRATEVNVRHNLWANQVHLDAGYPAVVHTHDFVLYKENTLSPHQFASDLYDYLTTYVATATAATELKVQKKSPATDVIVFGNCFANPPILTKPQTLLLTRAGFYSMRFLGTDIPTVVATP